MESLTKFDEFTEKHRKTRIMKKTIFGVLALIAGLLLLSFNLELIDTSWRHVIFSWQMLLVAIGLINVFDKDSFLTGIILLSIGTIFLLPEFMDVPFKLKQVFWPVILILIGIVAIIKHRFRSFGRKTGGCWKSKFYNEDFLSNDLSESGFISQTNIFGGSKKIFSSSVFKGGKITNIFGGGEIDFRHTQLAEGRIILDITSIFGGMSIIVPSDWIVNIEVDAIMGGFQDKRLIKPNNEIDFNQSELLIKGLAVFGGGELKSL